jgi:hypothetical protein
VIKKTKKRGTAPNQKKQKKEKEYNQFGAPHICIQHFWQAFGALHICHPTFLASSPILGAPISFSSIFGKHTPSYLVR